MNEDALAHWGAVEPNDKKEKKKPNAHTAYKTLETFVTSACFDTTLPSSGSFDTSLKSI